MPGGRGGGKARPPRSDAEKNLLRASRGAAAAALLLAPVVAWDINGGRRTMLAIINAPGDWGPLVTAHGAMLAFCLVYIVAGVAGCWGFRKKDLAVLAFAKLAAGIVVTAHLWPNYPLLDLWRASDWRLLWLVPAFVGGLWFVVLGAVQALLLTVGGGSAWRLIRRHLEKRRQELQPARPRSY